MSAVERDLERVREQIAEVDRGLLELFRRRLELAAEAGRIKAREGRPVVVREVEERVLGRARRFAVACGVSEESLEKVFRALIQASVERQYREGLPLRAPQKGRCLIVGGAGGMGSWLRGFLETAGHRIEVCDPAVGELPGEEGVFSRVDQVPDLDVYSAIVLAVPLRSTPEVLAQVVRRRPRARVVEVASIKTPLAPVLAEADELGVEVVCLHPMFGPGKHMNEDLPIVVAVRGGRSFAELRADLEGWLDQPYVRLVPLPFESHDVLMAWLLGLSHLSGIVFASALSWSSLSPDLLLRCASTTFERQAQGALSILGEDPDLYLDIQHANPHRRRVYEALRAAIDELEAAVDSCDRAAFEAIVARARAALGEGR